jgi:hypothetical protein
MGKRRGELAAEGSRRITLFVEILDLIGHDPARQAIASFGFALDPPTFMSASMNAALRHIEPARGSSRESNDAGAASKPGLARRVDRAARRN